MLMQDMYNYLENKNNGIVWDEELYKRLNNPKCIEKYGFKVYSQNDEDGILEEIFHRIGTTNKVFIEFGVQDGLESNGHYLILKGWKGLWIECDDKAYEDILVNFLDVIKSKALTIAHEFIRRDNINQIFESNNFVGEIDLLSIDIDGNDYYVWKEIEVISPRVVTIEYNAKIPPACKWIMPYCEYHIWDGGDKHGASLSALEELAKEKGYTLVGTNISGVNAFFVRDDCMNDKFASLSVNQLYNPPRYHKKFFAGHPSLYCLKDIPEGRRQLFCGKLENILIKEGFYQKESSEEIMYWMSEKRGILWIKDEDNKLSKIILSLGNLALILSENQIPSFVRIKVEGNVFLEYEFKQENMILEINIERETCHNDEVIELGIETDCLWKPKDETRQLGLCIHSMELLV